MSKGKVGEMGGEVVHGVGKVETKREMGEEGREMVNGVVKTVPEGEVGEKGREVVDFLIEMFALYISAFVFLQFSINQ